MKIEIVNILKEQGLVFILPNIVISLDKGDKRFIAFGWIVWAILIGKK